jgi:hypothetical protein
MKKYIIGIILGIVLCFGFTQAMADEKTYTLSEVGNSIKAIPEKVTYFIESEKMKTIAFQKDKWAEGQEQLKGTINKLKSLFVKG